MKKLVYFLLLASLLLSLHVYASSYFKGPALIQNTTTTATAGGTTTLTMSSETRQVFTGSSNQTIVLPDATTLPLGRSFEIFNQSTGTLTVNYDSGAAFTTVAAGQNLLAVVYGVGSSDGSWVASSVLTPTGILPLSKGGTSAALTAVNGGIVYSDANSMEILAAGTSGYILESNGAAAPSWLNILGVTHGGTGTSTQFTPGSVVFAGASGVYTQNNGQFFWDNSSIRLGIGTSSPSDMDVHIRKATVGGDVGLFAQNTDNTSGASNAAVVIQSGGSSAGDPKTVYVVNGVQNWSSGVDNSNSDAYVISPNYGLGTGDVLRFTPAGALTLPQYGAGILHSSSGGAITSSAVSLTADVSGILPIANGGTGQSSKAPAFDALSPMTTAGDLIYGGASGTGTRLATGTAGQFLIAGTTPSYIYGTSCGENCRHEFAYLTNSGSCAVSRQSGSWISSVGDPNPGRCTINFTWTSPGPTCVVSAVLPTGGGYTFCRMATVPSTSTLEVLCVVPGGSDTDAPFSILCSGPR